MKPAPSTGFKISQILDELSNKVLHLDANDMSYHIRYTDTDVVNAVLIFSHVVSNYGVHRMIDTGQIEENTKTAMFAESIHRAIKEFTDIDTMTFYRK